jgi:hypothetical protein
MHPLIEYIKQDSRYLVSPNKKLENFRDYLQNVYKNKQAEPRVHELINEGYKNPLDRRKIEFQDNKKPKIRGIPKKLPRLTPVKKPELPTINEMIALLKNIKT